MAPSGQGVPECLFTIMCDDVRREDNGKLIAIGVYMPDVLVPQIPFVFQQMVFLQLFKWPAAGLFHLRGSLECFSDQGVSQVATGMAMLQIVNPGPLPHAFRFGGISLQRTGEYVFRVFSEGERDPIVEHKFRVDLPPMKK